MDYVFDSSLMAGIIIPGEKNTYINNLCASIAEDAKIFVPQLIWYELGNIFNQLMRRKHYIFYDVLAFIPLLGALHLINDSESGPAYTESILRFAHDYYLNSYQAAYLELADRKKAMLCTLDKDLQNAAEIHGVKALQFA